MSWSWRYENGEGETVAGPDETFTSQADAESWIGQTWRDLLAAGTATAILVEDSRVEYKMSLLPASE